MLKNTDRELLFIYLFFLAFFSRSGLRLLGNVLVFFLDRFEGDTLFLQFF